MSLRINTNVAALNAHRNVASTDAKMSLSMARLSSGLRINSASDDAAGLAIANKLRTNVMSLTVASQNVTEGKAMVGIAEGSANQVESILERMKALATQASSDNAGTDVDKINAEFGTLKTEIDRIVNNTSYQGTKLLTGAFGSSLDTTASTADGVVGLDATGITTGGAAVGTFTIAQTAGGLITITGPAGVSQAISVTSNGVHSVNFDALGVSLTTNGSFNSSNQTMDGKTVVVAGTSAEFQVGSGNVSTEDRIQVTLGDLRTTAIGTGAGSMISDGSLANKTSAQTALGIIDSAITSVNTVLGTIGATVNRMDYTYNNLQVTIQNFSASESAIRDVDMASEMTNYTKNQILLQAGTAMLAQANSSSQGVLSLFK